MSSGLGLPYSISLLYGSMFWGYSKDSRANSNYEFVGIKRIKCYLPWKIHLWCNTAIVHTLSSGYNEGRSPCVPCLYARTSHTQHLPTTFQTSASTCNHWWRTRIWNLQNSRLQDWPPEGMQTALQSYMVGIWGHRQRLQIVTSSWTRTR